MKIWNKNTFILVVILLFSLDVLVWRTIVFAKPAANLEIYFLDVGQGDSELVVLPGGVQVLIDGGKGNYAVRELTSILPFFDRYLDLVILSHPELDHFLGLIEVLKSYQVGAFISNGRPGTADSWSSLVEILNKENIPRVILAAGDKISYQENYFDVLSPTPEFLNGRETNDSGLVMKLIGAASETLFTGDVGEKVEKFLIKNSEIKADILKIGHHGSKFSSSREFLANVQPQLAFIEVGKNSYGHPTPEVLKRLADIGASIYRTDLDGTIKLVINNGQISILKRE